MQEGTHLQFLNDALELRLVDGKSTALGTITVVEAQPGLVNGIYVIGTCVLRQGNDIRQVMQLRRIVLVFGNAQIAILRTVGESEEERVLGLRINQAGLNSQLKVVCWRHNRLGQNVDARLRERVGVDGHLDALLPFLLPLVRHY